MQSHAVVAITVLVRGLESILLQDLFCPKFIMRCMDRCEDSTALVLLGRF